MSAYDHMRAVGHGPLTDDEELSPDEIGDRVDRMGRYFPDLDITVDWDRRGNYSVEVRTNDSDSILLAEFDDVNDADNWIMGRDSRLDQGDDTMIRAQNKYLRARANTLLAGKQIIQFGDGSTAGFPNE